MRHDDYVYQGEFEHSEYWDSQAAKAKAKLEDGKSQEAASSPDHPLYGIDPVVVYMAVKAPNEAPVELKALMVKAAIDAGASLPLREVLSKLKKLAKECGYELRFTEDRVAPETAKDFEALKKIIMEVSKKHMIPVESIKGTSRVKGIMPARQEFYYRARTETFKSYPEIGSFCGDRDHSTIHYGARRYAQLNNLKMPT